jgi:hypothetical protein
MAKNIQYLKRVARAAHVADATAELSPAALEALMLRSDRMSAPVFNELTSKGYLVAERRGWSFSMKAEAYRAAAGNGRVA